VPCGIGKKPPETPSGKHSRKKKGLCKEGGEAGEEDAGRKIGKIFERMLWGVRIGIGRRSRKPRKMKNQLRARGPSGRRYHHVRTRGTNAVCAEGEPVLSEQR